MRKRVFQISAMVLSGGVLLQLGGCGAAITNLLINTVITEVLSAIVGAISGAATATAM